MGTRSDEVPGAATSFGPLGEVGRTAVNGDGHRCKIVLKLTIRTKLDIFCSTVHVFEVF